MPSHMANTTIILIYFLPFLLFVVYPIQYCFFWKSHKILDFDRKTLLKTHCFFTILGWCGLIAFLLLFILIFGPVHFQKYSKVFNCKIINSNKINLYNIETYNFLTIQFEDESQQKFYGIGCSSEIREQTTLNSAQYLYYLYSDTVNCKNCNASNPDINTYNSTQIGDQELIRRNLANSEEQSPVFVQYNLSYVKMPSWMCLNSYEKKHNFENCLMNIYGLESEAFSNSKQLANPKLQTSFYQVLVDYPYYPQGQFAIIIIACLFPFLIWGQFPLFLCFGACYFRKIKKYFSKCIGKKEEEEEKQQEEKAKQKFNDLTSNRFKQDQQMIKMNTYNEALILQTNQSNQINPGQKENKLQNSNLELAIINNNDKKNNDNNVSDISSAHLEHTNNSKYNKQLFINETAPFKN